MKKKKNAKKDRPSRSLSVPSRTINDRSAIPPAPHMPAFFQWTIFFLLGVSLFLYTKPDKALANGFLLGTFGLQVLLMLSQRRIPWLQRWLFAPAPWKGSLLLLFAAAGFALGLFTFPCNSWLLPASKSWTLQQSYWILLVSWVVMVLSFRFMPEGAPGADLGSRTSRFLLLAALGLGAFFRFYHIHSTQGHFWDDQAMEVMDVRYARDLSDFRNFFVIPNGAREPFYGYFMYFLWMLLPQATCVVIERLADGIIDLAAVLFVYLAAKEAVNRRTGVMAAILAAVSKALLIKCLTGMRIFTMGLAMALALWAFFRMVKKPDLSRFLLWGAAVAFGAYTYGTYRPVILFFIFLGLAWVWSKQRPLKGQDRRVLILTGTSALFFLLYFLYTNNSLPHGLWLVRVVDVAGPFLPCLLLGSFLIYGFRAIPLVVSNPKNTLWLDWLAGSWFCVVLSFPMIDNPAILGRVQSLQLTDPGLLGILGRILEQFRQAFQLLFFGGYDRSDMFIPDDSLFGYTEVLLTAVGLALVAARPTRVRILLALAALIGLVPYALTQTSHTGRAAACIVPFLLIGATGLEGFLSGLSQLPARRYFLGAAYVLLLALLGWTARGTFTSLFVRWWPTYLTGHTLSRDWALKDLAEGDRVYFADSLVNRSGAVVMEGHPVDLFRATGNVLYLGSSEKVPNVAVYMEPSAGGLRSLLQGEFPTAQWTELRFPLEADVKLYRCLIPFADLYAADPASYEDGPEAGPGPSSPRPLLRVHRVEPPYWERQYSRDGYGLTFSMLEWEDKVADARSPASKEFGLDGFAVRCRGTVHIGAPGRYLLTLNCPDRFIMRIDGRRIFDVSYFQDEVYYEPPRTRERTVELGAGDHSVEIDRCYQRSFDPPEITLVRKGSDDKGRSLWSSFNF